MSPPFSRAELVRPQPVQDTRAFVERERLALFETLAADELREAAVAARNGRRRQKGLHKLGAGRILKLFTERIVEVDLDPDRARQRLDGLDAAHVRARHDPIDLEATKERDERCRLLAAALVERPQPVVAVPLVGVARPRVSNEEHHSVRANALSYASRGCGCEA